MCHHIFFSLELPMYKEFFHEFFLNNFSIKLFKLRIVYKYCELGISKLYKFFFKY